MPGRTIAIGDIHGSDVALETLIAMIKPTEEDTIVVLGDVVDRGPDTKRCIELLLDLRTRCQLVFIEGNHEEMMLMEASAPEFATQWRTFGGMETLESYGSSFDDIPEEHMSFLRSGLNYWETETELFIHANIEPGVPMKDQKSVWLRWTHLTGFESSPIEGKRVICGHTAQSSGVPSLLTNWICIDTKAHAGNPLTAFDVGSNMFYQANMIGDAREFSLEQLQGSSS